MGRILAIDFGTKRVGLAVTDPLRIIASPLETVHAKDVIQYIKDYDATEGIDEIVLGMPKKLDGTSTNATQHVQNFHKNLKKQFPEKPVYLHDERFTSKIALDAMIAAGSKKKDRREKGNIDKVSAAVILQSYLESKQI
jgi:putative Holliday junction resolvase